MAVPKKKTSKSRTRSRRAHHALVAIVLVACPKCGAKKMRHSACPECGTYRGRTVLDVRSRKEKKAEKKKARKAKPTAKDTKGVK